MSGLHPDMKLVAGLPLDLHSWPAYGETTKPGDSSSKHPGDASGEIDGLACAKLLSFVSATLEHHLRPKTPRSLNVPEASKHESLLPLARHAPDGPSETDRS